MEDGMSVECSNCGFVFQNEEPNKPRENWKPCPQCGSFKRMVRLTHEETLELHEYRKLKAKNLTSRHRHKFDYELHQGEDYHIKKGDWVDKEVIFDREHYHYEETISKDGEIIFHKEQDLSEKKEKSSKHRKS
jgi:DNA-directed RNA polymerase subunit RPC12/RpoP